MNRDSPNKKILRKLWKSKTAVVGIGVILFVCFLAIFGYVLAPDNSTDANQQFAVLAEHSPGTSMQFIKLKQEVSEGVKVKKSWLTGRDKAYTLLPIVSYKTGVDGAFLIEEYKGEGVTPLAYNLNASQLHSAKGEEAFLEENIVTKTFWLGTDQLGRDVLSRLIIGARVSILVGLVAVIISTFLGVVIGSFAGFYRGWIDALVMWQLSVVWSIPTLLLAMALYISLKDYFDSSYMIIFIAIGCTMWVSMARIVRGQILGIREIQFVEAANSLGYSDVRIVFKHILPNIIAPVIVIAASNFANAILIEAGLSFLGLGIQPPTPSWGGMLSEFKDLIGTNLSYLAFFPGILIMILVLSFNLVGNGLRDAIDIKNN